MSLEMHNGNLAKSYLKTPDWNLVLEYFCYIRKAVKNSWAKNSAPATDQINNKNHLKTVHSCYIHKQNELLQVINTESSPSVH